MPHWALAAAGKTVSVKELLALAKTELIEYGLYRDPPTSVTNSVCRRSIASSNIRYDRKLMATTTKRLITDVRRVWQNADPRSAALWTAGLFMRAPAIIKTRGLVPADQMLVNRTECLLRPNGVRVALPGTMFSGAREMYCRGVYWPNEQFRVAAHSVVVDIGANVGLYSLYAAAAGATVVAVEAQRSFSESFHELMQSNGVTDRVTLVHAVVGARTGLASDPDGFRAEARALGDDPPVQDISEILANFHLHHVDVCKIDIEGSEFDMFSKPQWLDHCDRITMEVHGDFGHPEKIVATCEAAGFNVTRCTPDQEPVPLLVGDGLLYAVRRTLGR